MATVLTKLALKSLWASYHNTNEETVTLFIDYLFGGAGAGSTFLKISGGTMTGAIVMGTNNINDVGSLEVDTIVTPAASSDLTIRAIGPGQNIVVALANDFSVTAGNDISFLQATGAALRLGKNNGTLGFFQQAPVIRQIVDNTNLVAPVDLATALVEIVKLQTTVTDIKKALGNTVGGGYGLVELNP